jgi:L-ascorbate metabolism protein UlaG (beta-lactamase superfamily)
MVIALSIFAVLLLALWLGWRLFKLRVARDWWHGPPSDHFDGQRFFNPGTGPHAHGTRAMIEWKRNAKPVPWPAHVTVTQARPAASVEGDAMVATVVGHACVLVQTQGLNILTDPVFAERASPFSWAGPRRVRAPGVALIDLPRIDIVLLSHNHYDHMCLPTLKALWSRDRPRILTPIGNGALLARHGIAATEGDWGDAVAACGVTVHFDAVQHWASRWGFDRNRALWCGFTVDLPDGNLFFAGDCGYNADYFARVARHGPPRLALLPVGAYEPRWFMGHHHMNPDDAVMAFNDIGAVQAIGIHWGVWQLTDEGIDEPREALDVALDAAGIARERFRAEVPGTVVGLSAPTPATGTVQHAPSK